jgi:hypothetical protein
MKVQRITNPFQPFMKLSETLSHTLLKRYMKGFMKITYEISRVYDEGL